MSIFNLGFGEESLVFASPLHRLADHYALPFLTGTDGLTWRQRTMAARRYGATMRQTSADVSRVHARLAERARDPRNT